MIINSSTIITFFYFFKQRKKFNHISSENQFITIMFEVDLLYICIETCLFSESIGLFLTTVPILSFLVNKIFVIVGFISSLSSELFKISVYFLVVSIPKNIRAFRTSPFLGLVFFFTLTFSFLLFHPFFLKFYLWEL